MGGDTEPPATIPNPIVTRLRIGSVHIALQKTTLKKVQDLLGGTSGSIPGSAVGPEWLCFIGKETSGTWALWLESYDIDGGTVGEFQWRRLGANAKLDARCKNLPQGLDHISLGPTHLGLGMTEHQVRQILGKPSEVKGNTLIYAHEHELKHIKRGPFTFSNGATVVIQDGKVIAIGVGLTIVN